MRRADGTKIRDTRRKAYDNVRQMKFDASKRMNLGLDDAKKIPECAGQKGTLVLAERNVKEAKKELKEAQDILRSCAFDEKKRVVEENRALYTANQNVDMKERKERRQRAIDEEERKETNRANNVAAELMMLKSKDDQLDHQLDGQLVTV